MCLHPSMGFYEIPGTIYLYQKRGEYMENLNKSIGSRISQLRKNRGITQEKLAEEIDITTKHMSSVERGASSLSLEKLITAVKCLDCTLDYLILGDEQKNDTGSLPASILSILSSDDEKEKELLIEYINLYAKIRR